MSKVNKLQKHIEELAELEKNTSGGAHDAVTFTGKGLELLKSIFRAGKLSKKSEDEDEDYDDEDDLEKSDSSLRNGGGLEEADEDPEDPADTGEDEEGGAKGGSIITNKGKRIPKKGSPAVKHYEFDEERFEKNFIEEYAEVLDATPALAELAKSFAEVGQAVTATNATIAEIQRQNVILAKAVAELLKSNAALASDLELIKKQPVNTPASGFVVMQKKEGHTPKTLRKSDIEDTLIDLMNAGKVEPMLVKKLGAIRNQQELEAFVESLPYEVRELL
jgi:hypothetical protein